MCPSGEATDQQRLILAALGEVGSAAPATRDRAFGVLRRLLAATLAAQRWLGPRIVRTFRPGRLERLEAAIATSVTVLEQIPRDSLDFLIEVRLLEEVLAVGAGPDDGAPWGVPAVAGTQQVLDDLPFGDGFTFQQLCRAADDRARVLVAARTR